MEEKQKEARKCVIEIELFYDKESFKPKVTIGNLNMPVEVIVTQLRSLVKLLEEEIYPDFKNNITKIGVRPE